MPLLCYPGAALVGVHVRDVVTSPEAQVAALQALHTRYSLPVLLTAMDLSVEAEAWGCPVEWGEHGIPSVTGPMPGAGSDPASQSLPEPGTGRTAVYLETAQRLARLRERPVVLGGMIGPFSLAARVAGVSEMLGMTLEDPGRALAWVNQATTFLLAYARAFRDVGADGVVMAEPTAGLLSPAGLEAFSARAVRRLVEAVETPAFGLVLHNCAARSLHLPALRASGVCAFHFGAPMDLDAALAAVPESTLVCGNLDPAGVLVRSSAREVFAATRRLCRAHAGKRNFVLSSGCDVPPETPLENLDAFFAAAQEAAREVSAAS